MAANLHYLAAVLCVRGDLDQAQQLYRRALAIKENLLGAGGPDAALTLNYLGALLNRTGLPEKAAGLLGRARRTPTTKPMAQCLCLSRVALGKEGENTDTYSLLYAPLQPRLPEKTIVALNQQRVACRDRSIFALSFFDDVKL